MFRIDDATAATSLPIPESAGTEGYYTEGNPATGTPATNVRASWLNMIQEELRALVVYGGLTPSKTVYTQIRDAIVAKFAKLNGDSTQVFSVAAATASQHAVQLGQVAAWMRNYIAGLTLSNDGTNPNTQIDFAPGVAVDSTNTWPMTLSSTTVKTLQSSGAWAAGTGNNGLFSGSKAASTWYHCFLIRNGTTGAIDAGFDTSVTAANIPSGWTAYRRVGSILTDGSGNIRTFTQVGDEFLWTVPLRDINVTGVALGPVNYAVTVPPGVIVVACIQGIASSTPGSASVNINAPGYSDVASYNAPTFITPAANQSNATGRVYIRTNTAQQIQITSNIGGNTYSFGAYGWRDYRGTNN